MPSRRIEDYALIGDCETAALVSRDGSIDWLCWPDFSSPACFASLLGSPENGHWSCAPITPHTHSRRRYRPHTLILETTLTTPTGTVLLTDFMPIRIPRTYKKTVSALRHILGILSGSQESRKSHLLG